MYSLSTQAYGKDKVRLVRVKLLPADAASPHLTRHSVAEYSVQVLLEGAAFTASYTHADNSQVVATDTVKNTIYLVARRGSLGSPEAFARELSENFLSAYSHVERVRVRVTQLRWTRIATTTLKPTEMPFSGSDAALQMRERPGCSHPHSFVRDGDETRIAEMVASRTGARGSPVEYALSAGLSNLLVLKTTGSSFENFHRCPNRTLPDMADRLLSTSVEAFYTFAPSTTAPASDTVPYDAIFIAARQAILDIFANHNSPSVQNTLFIMGTHILGLAPNLTSIRFALPNKHNFAVDLSRFGVKNEGKVGEGQTVFMPIDAPSGMQPLFFPLY